MSDARAIVRLLGEIASMPRDHGMARQELMDGLCKLVAADCWVWAFHGEAGDGVQATPVRYFHGGFTDEQFARYLDIVSHADMAGLNSHRLACAPTADRILTRNRDQIIPNEIFPASASLPYWKAADLVPVLLSSRSHGHEGSSQLAMFRRWDAAPFDERERKIASIILSELPWLHTADWPEPSTTAMPPLTSRERMILDLLIQGLNRQEIAEQLGISPFTVGDYIKSIYRKCGVNSLVGLLSRFRQGDVREGTC